MNNINFDFLCVDIKRMLKSIQYMKSKKMAEYGLKGSTVQCLCRIAECKQGLNAGELSEQLNIDKAQVSRCVAELGEMGLVFRDEKQGKQYRQKYCLTEQGQHVARDIIKTSSDIHNVISKGVRSEDVEAFYRVLEVLCRNSQAFYMDEEK